MSRISVGELQVREKPLVDAVVRTGKCVPCYAVRDGTPSVWSIEFRRWLAIRDDGTVADPRVPAMELTDADIRDLLEMVAEYRQKRGAGAQ